jgi:hypothetical protein
MLRDSSAHLRAIRQTSPSTSHHARQPRPLRQNDVVYTARAKELVRINKRVPTELRLGGNE